MDWDKISPVEDTQEVNLSHLHFDMQNPRFTPDKKPEEDTDQAVISKLASTADLPELVQSIATSGYINIEPLIVVLRNDRLIVLEGNRRLAAIKCLLNPAYAKEAKITVPEFGDEVHKTLDNIRVYRVAHEDDARELIGFKHINGPQAWDAYAKAEFAGNWLDTQTGAQNPLTLTDIANRMGDGHSTILRMVTALYVLRQAEENGVYSIEDRQKKSFSFSHLYTGLTYETFTSYLEMERPTRDANPSPTPIAKENFLKLRKLLVWLYGSKSEDIQPVIRSQNPDLGALRDVLSSPTATRELEERADLDAAIITATPTDVRFSRHLFNANAELQKALQALDGFDAETQSELQDVAISAQKRAALIRAAVDTAVAELEDSNK
jgi:hypothetical protein